MKPLPSTRLPSTRLQGPDARCFARRRPGLGAWALLAAFALVLPGLAGGSQAGALAAGGAGSAAPETSASPETSAPPEASASPETSTPPEASAPPETSALPEASAPEVREDWYRLEIGGEPAGWVRLREERRGEEISTETEMEMSFKRGGTEVTVGLATRFVETAAGEAVSMWVSQATGQVPVETTYLFRSDHLEVRSVQGETASESRQPLPAAPWLPPAAAQRRLLAQIADGADRYGYRTIDPSLGPVPVDIVGTRTGTGVEVVLPGGETVITSRWSQAQEPGPGVESVLYLDADGRLVKSVTPMLGAELVLLLADREGAREARRQAPELLVSTFVRPDRPIPRPRGLRRAAYALRSSRGELAPLPSSGGQRVEQAMDAARVRVSADGAGPAEEEIALASYLESSVFLNHRDPAVRALAEGVLAEIEDGPAVQAEALRAFVHRYLEEKDLGTGFATASEVAARRSGDCTEHSVLLAALLRAAGIPARVVVGLLYVESFAGEREIFGYHMWSQAWIGGRWVDLDALTPRAFDAAHIALATSSLNDGEGLAGVAASMAGLMGALEIEVVELER